jgi:hypothetical protein
LEVAEEAPVRINVPAATVALVVVLVVALTTDMLRREPQDSEQGEEGEPPLPITVLAGEEQD